MSLLTASLLAAAAIAADAPVDPSVIAAYRALNDQDLRLASIGYRLASANAPYCKRTERSPGWVIHDIAQYPDRAPAKAAFGFDQPIHVAAVIKDGPADRANIKAGDGFVGFDGTKLNWTTMPVGEAGYERIASFKQLLSRRSSEQPDFPMQLLRNGAEFKTVLSAPLICASEFQIDTSDGVNAGADGEIVRVTYGMMAFVQDDSELAALVAHELAHNILRHRDRLNAQGVDRGIGRLFGKSKNAILATEIEADRLSPWLMANAGYDPGAALRFWERHGRKFGLGIFSEGTHLRWKNRVKLIQSEIDLMANTEKRDGTLPPPLLVIK